jgi:hypothetical protein
MITMGRLVAFLSQTFSVDKDKRYATELIKYHKGQGVSDVCESYVMARYKG